MSLDEVQTIGGNYEDLEKWFGGTDGDGTVAILTVALQIERVGDLLEELIKVAKTRVGGE